MPIVLTIAGFDPTGGAGVLVDQRVIEAMDCNAVSVVTALTGQNTHGVSSVHAATPEALRSQLDTLLGDVRPDAVKIGLLPGAEHVEIVADAIERFRLQHVVIDPVIAPTSGKPFLNADGVRILLSRLIPLADIVTPNAPEADCLSSCDVTTHSGMEEAGRALLRMGAKGLLIKGGHLRGPENSVALDLLIDSSHKLTWLAGGIVDTMHRHGTGCYLSAAIAAGVARGQTLDRAARRAKWLIEDSLARPRIVGEGRGSPGAPDVARIDTAERALADRLARMTGIYFVTDDRLGSARKVRESVQAALRGGVRIIQLRDKSLPTVDLIELALTVRDDVRKVGGLFIMNDHVEIAREVDADGVHLGPDDISPARARQMLGSDKLVGVSANCDEELQAYGIGGIATASYVGCGPVFGTSTKHDAGGAIGTDGLSRMLELTSLPVVAIGGIGVGNIASVRESGVDGAAVVSAISKASHPEAEARRLVEIWKRTISKHGGQS